MELIRDIKTRVKNIRINLEETQLDAILATEGRNTRYLTGKETGRVLITPDEAIVWVRSIYKDLYESIYEDRDYPLEVREYETGRIKEHIKKTKVSRLGIENIGIDTYNKLSSELPCTLCATDMINKCRMVKSEYEISQIKKACEIAAKAMDNVDSMAQEGACELDVTAETEALIRRLGSETPPFEGGMLFATGESSADIHAYPQKKAIANGSLCVADLGARWNGYHSDMTRTFATGKIKKEENEIIEFIENLELEAIDLLKTGMPASEAHGFCDREIQKRGYRFYHSTGHGVGLNIHEGPNLGPGSDDILEENMVFTIEPGIYVPGKFGVRFEDTILLRKNKTENLTRV